MTTDPEIINIVIDESVRIIAQLHAEIEEKRNAILRHSALIVAIKKKGYYEQPQGNETDKEIKQWWIRQVGEKNIYWTDKKKKT